MLKQAEEGKTALIFGYGNLNLTPLVSALISSSTPQSDVLIGIPRSRYQRLNEIYKTNYFSLLYGNGKFFYKDSLWCSARLDNDYNNYDKVTFDLTNFKTKPKWGDRSYKKQIDRSLKEDITSGDVNRRSLIITFPISTGLPELIIENPVFRTSGKEYHLRQLKPRFLILESADEVMPNIRPLISIINVLLERKIGSIIHFSWPYPKGLDRFIEQYNELDSTKKSRISLFHLGRSLCVKSKELSLDEIKSCTKEKDISRALQHYPAIKELSVEGGSWSSYYPDTIKDVSNHMLIYLVGRATVFSNNIPHITEPTETDRLIRYLREELAGMKFFGNIGYILSFLPFVDSFVLPSEFKILFKDNEVYKRVGLRLAIERAKERANDLQELILNRLLYIVNRLSTVEDISLSIQGLKTPSNQGKSTGLMSYLLQRSFMGKNVSMIVCEYSSRNGLVSYSSNYYKKILEDLRTRLPFRIDSFFNQGLNLLDMPTMKLLPFESATEIHELDYSSRSGGQFLEIRLKLLMGNGSFRNCEVRVSFENITSLGRNINNYDTANTELLLPGPIPFLTYEREVPRVFKGLDIIYRPFKRVIFFSYPGEDFLRISNQLSVIKGLLLGESNNLIVKKDLAISKGLNNVLTRDIFEQEASEQPMISNLPCDEDYDGGPLDDAFIRTSIEYEKRADPIIGKTLMDLWDSISKSRNEKAVQQSLPANEGLVKLKVRFDGMTTDEEVWLRRGSYVRVVENEDTQLIQTENLAAGQRIAYMESGTRESLDDSFVREYTSYRGITIERIFESFEYLRRFCRVLLAQNFEIEYSFSNYADLTWLSESQKESLYATLKFLIRPIPESESSSAQIKEFFENNEVWPQIAELPPVNLVKLKKIFETDGVSFNSLHALATQLGMNYKVVSFKQLLSELNSGSRRYYFEEPDNLLAVSLLLINQRIEEDYEELTSAGKEIRVVLQLVGRSIQRVIRGESASLNEMDSRIRDNVRMCRIISTV